MAENSDNYRCVVDWKVIIVITSKPICFCFFFCLTPICLFFPLSTLSIYKSLSLAAPKLVQSQNPISPISWIPHLRPTMSPDWAVVLLVSLKEQSPNKECLGFLFFCHRSFFCSYLFLLTTLSTTLISEKFVHKSYLSLGYSIFI